MRITSPVLVGLLALAGPIFAGLGSALADEPLRPAPPMRPIVGGHNVQPRADVLSVLGRPDLTPKQAREVDQLYQELIARSALARPATS